MLIIFSVVGAIALIASVFFKSGKTELSIADLDMSYIEREVAKGTYAYQDGKDNLEEAVERTIDFIGADDDAADYIRNYFGV